MINSRSLRKATIPFLLFFITAGHLGLAQEKRHLTLEQSIDIALAKSHTAKSLEQSLINSRMSLKAAEAGFKSNGNLVFSSLPNYQQTERQTALPGGGYVFDRQKFMNLQTELYVNQPISATNGVFSVVGAFQRFQQFGRVEGYSIINGIPISTVATDPSDFSPQLRMQFRQPLFTPNHLKLGFQKARLNLENTLQTYTRNQHDIIYSVTTGFYDLYRAQRQVEIDQEQVQQSENAYRIAKLKEQAGLLPEVEALRLEIELANARNTAATSEANLQRAEDVFKVQIGIPIEDTVQVSTALSYRPIDVTIAKALTEALQRRTELRSNDIEIQLDEISVRETDALSQISGELFLSYGIFNRQEQLEEAFQNFNNDRIVTLSMTIPLWDWGKNGAEVQAANATLENSRLSKQNRVDIIKQEIRNAVRSLQSAQQRVEITKRSEELAEKSYRISLLRFENGDLSSQDLALEQNRLTQARTNSLNAIIDYKQSLADLRRKTLWDFEKDAPVQIELPEE